MRGRATLLVVLAMTIVGYTISMLAASCQIDFFWECS